MSLYTPLFHGPLTPGKKLYFAIIFIVNIPSGADVKSICFIAPRSSSHANLPYCVLYRLERRVNANTTRSGHMVHISRPVWRDAQRKVCSLRHWQHFHLVFAERNILTFMEREFAALCSNNMTKVTWWIHTIKLRNKRKIFVVVNLRSRKFARSWTAQMKDARGLILLWGAVYSTTLLRLYRVAASNFTFFSGTASI